jgi:IS5 family transposase
MDWAPRTKVRRRATFFAGLGAVITWARRLAVIAPRYPNAPQGQPPHPLPRTLHIHLMQPWFKLSDPRMEDVLDDRESVHLLAGFHPTTDQVPDDTLILHFRHLLRSIGWPKGGAPTCGRCWRRGSCS